MRIFLLAAAAALTLAAACGGGETVAVGKLPRLVLQPDDMRGFTLFDEGRQSRADLGAGERADPGRFGRKGGWKARYRRSGGEGTRGPLVVESRADLFEKTDGAKKELDAYRRQLVPSERPVQAPELGDEAAAFTTTQESLAGDVRFYTIAWREANVTASVLVEGFDGNISLDDALALARKQERRIRAAA